MQSTFVLTVLCLFTGLGCTIRVEVENEDDRCEIMMKKIVSDDRETVTDETPFRLHSTWVSQECEVRAGPTYVTRKYSFFKNGTFRLLQFHYAEESCSIATYNVVARGSIELLSPSISIPGATKDSVQLDSVHLIPLNRQVAHKFGRRMNASCGGIDTKLRPYVAQLIYERPIDSPSNTSFQMHDLKSNSLQSRVLRARKRYTPNCLESFGIEFSELRLLRVEIRRSSFATNPSGRETVGRDKKMPARVELFLGGLARNVRSQKTEHRPNRLQATSLVRADTIVSCPICASVYRATEYSPPLFLQAPSLPAVIGGLWLSIRCESVDGGFWSRRFFRIYSNDNRWFARWTYYSDSACSNSLYTVAASGTYVQRAVRKARNAERSNANIFNDDARLGTFQEKSGSKVYRHILQDTVESITLQGNRRRKEVKIDRRRITGRVLPFSLRQDFMVPSGMTELELQLFEIASTRCSTDTGDVRQVKRTRESEARPWTKSCPPRTVEASATLMFKAKINLDWNGDYTLFLASWKDDLWEAPLYRCSGVTSRHYLHQPWHEYLSLFQKDNWYERFDRYRQYRFSSSFASSQAISSALINWVTLLLWLCWLHLIF